MLDKLMTQEEQEAFVRQVWERQKAEIEKSVEYAIRTEMSTRMQSMAHRMVGAELKELLKPMLEAKKEELQRAAQVIVDRMYTRLEATVIDLMRDAFAGSYTDYTEKLAQTFQGRLRSVMEKLLSYDYKTGKYIEKTDA